MFFVGTRHAVSLQPHVFKLVVLSDRVHQFTLSTIATIADTNVNRRA
jgi:hypothetical protein